MKTDFFGGIFQKAAPFPHIGPEKSGKEICADMAKGLPMRRLLQGDVGSGKTAVAAAALYTAFKTAGRRPLWLPPKYWRRSILIRLKAARGGHEHRPSHRLADKKDKSRNLCRPKSGKTDLVIGTHALIQQGVTFKNLGLVITDEQHRFGSQAALKPDRKRVKILICLSCRPPPFQGVLPL